MATMQQVADRAGVSIATVSFVLNNTKQVRPETRERILAATDVLGYRMNVSARALATRRSRVIALLYPFMERNLNAFVEEAAAVAEKHGYHLILWPVHPEKAAAEVASLVHSGIADGVLLLEVQLDDERVVKLRAEDAPFALIGRTRDTAGIDYADIDFEQTTMDAITYLAGLGHQHIALVIEDLDGTAMAGYGPPVRVEQTFREELIGRSLDGQVFRVPHDPQAHLALAGRVAEQAPQTTAIIMMYDEASFGLVNGLRQRGVTIPQDLSIIALAPSTPLGFLINPGLTTYDAPTTLLGRLAAEALIARLKGSSNPPSQMLIPCHRNDGASVAAAPVGRPPLNVPATIDVGLHRHDES